MQYNDKLNNLEASFFYFRRFKPDKLLKMAKTRSASKNNNDQNALADTAVTFSNQDNYETSMTEFVTSTDAVRHREA